MRIKRIDLCGFKSFCDKAVLDLRQRLTAVVGPNGCGKSNVVDALRWAMGEQSARHLRGKAMEDVIFNGSDSRGPSGVAEVSITFENDGRVPPEYVGYEEITVTRRLHRDGTSEYLINRLPVRLRDITNLFLGTGVGTKAYAIIEQGRVGLIVSAKPEDRRYFIDEVAGITKYRRRKVAAERKMEATRQNLLRVNDVLGEIETRLGLLRRQAKKAARYKEYKSEMRDIELCAASHGLLELIAEGKLIDATISELEQQRTVAESELEKCELDVETARMEAADEERRLTGMQEALYQLDNRIKLSENAAEFQSHEADDLEQRAEQARGEVEELARQIADAEQQRAEVSQRWQESSGEREALDGGLARCQQTHAELREAFSAVQHAVEEERGQAGEAERAVARAEANLRAIEQRRSETTSRIDRWRDEAARVLDRLVSLRESATTIDEQLGDLRLAMDKLHGLRESAEARIEDLSETCKRGEAELEILHTELHRRRSRLASLEEIHGRYEGFARGTRAVMQRVNGNAVERGVLGVVADIVEAAPAYEIALEAVLDQRLGTVIVDRPEIGVEAISYLKEHAEGRSSFIARSPVPNSSLLDSAPVGVVFDARGAEGGVTMSAGGGMQTVEATPGRVHGPMLGLIECKEEFRGVAENLLADVVVVERLEDGLDLWDKLPGKTIVTLDGEILHPSGTVTGGSLDAELSGVLRQKREIKELKEIIAGLERDYDARLQSFVGVKTELSTLQQDVEEATRDGHQGDKAILTHEKDLGRIASEIESLESRYAELDADLTDGHRLLCELVRQERGLELEIECGADSRRLSDEILYLLARERGRLASLVEQAAGDVTDAHVALAQADASCAAIEGQLRQLDQLCADRATRIERLGHSAQESTARAEELRRKVARLREDLAEMVTQRADEQDALSAGRTVFDERVAAVGELEHTIKDLRQQANALQSRVGEQQIRASEQKMRSSHLEQQVWERYHESLRRVAGDYHLRAPVTEEQTARLEQLRQLIHRMGEINLTAIDEYEELSGRYEFLKTHRDDLESALSQLQRAIQKINRICRKRFKETFDLVNDKFQEVFPRLFKGGRAKLLLTDPEGDLLQGGVDIIAQPPGKKLQSLEMMSGGEKALTAVSLIFAMFLVKPTPFCLLDEVDAPLDEANVVRFRDMIAEMADTSQFIVITHNRRTMEIGERLYGVTMEEPGISKLVSVNLNDAVLN